MFDTILTDLVIMDFVIMSTELQINRQIAKMLFAEILNEKQPVPYIGFWRDMRSIGLFMHGYKSGYRVAEFIKG